MAAAKKQTKKDLETKIAELEAKLTKLATQLEAKPTPKPAETKPAEVKPAETKPAETAKPKPTLPKGSEVKPAETSKPKPKPAETTSQPPATLQAALEDAYYNSQMSDFHQYRAKVTGYSPAPNRYHVRRTAPVGRVPTTNWNDQKLKVTGYTPASNQYFATRARMAYHPADKTFGSFSGVNMTFDGIVEQTQQQQAPPQEAPKPKGTLPKGF
ncbi:MAG: trans-sialidase [Nitrosopumilus sp.]|nr:trans-sialidase [Nitrosopumilus sp.]NRA05408.1 trans-sialidase [Nitrosopumilus sp.]